MIKRAVIGVLLAAFGAAVVFFGGWVQIFAFVLLCVVSVSELGGVFSAKGYRPRLWPAYAFAVLSGVGLQLGGPAIMAGLFALCIVSVAIAYIFDPNRNAFDAVCSLFIFIYPLSLYAILILIACYPDFALSRAALLLSIAAPSAADMGAYFVGTFFGKHKLCPQLSPKKTVEGSVGGFAGGLLGGVAVYYLQGIWGAAVPLWHLAVLGTLFGGLSQIGDLFASSLKRWAGVKDYGRLFPGHGGAMDRMDSILMCAPVVFVYLYCL